MSDQDARSAATTSSGGGNTLAGGHPDAKKGGPAGGLPRPEYLAAYATVVVDPPWAYADGFNGFGDRRELPYPSMTVTEIATLPIARLVQREGYIFLWTTNRYLPDAADLVRGWGFSYRQTLTWDKGVGSGGLGGMFATTSEFVVVAQNIRPGTNAHGSRTKRLRHEESVLRFPRQPRHSQKPEAFYDLVEQVAPGPYLDMFARRQRLGWDVWGNEVDSDVEMIA